jgi:putative ABC transport system ATP-binding protein
LGISRSWKTIAQFGALIEGRMGLPALHGLHLKRSFGERETQVTVLDDVSIEIARGEFVLLMGPSGSGKSTLLAILSGLLPPDSGRVLTLGEDLWAMSGHEREHFRLKHTSFVFQGYDLFPALTAREQLEMVLRWGEACPRREARERADQTLALLGLAGKVHLRPCQLSGGEKQRVAVARALVKKPTFCFADEPTGALDWTNGRGVIELLREAADKDGTTVLVVGHDERVIPYADRVYLLENGCLDVASRRMWRRDRRSVIARTRPGALNRASAH